MGRPTPPPAAGWTTPSPPPAPPYGWAPYAPPAQEGAGLGLALAGAGVAAGLVSLFALPWVDGGAGADDPTFTDLRDAVVDLPNPTEVVPDIGVLYVEWAAFATFGVVALLAVLAGIGLRSGATTVVRTLGVLAALGALPVHFVGVHQLFAYEQGHVDLGLGNWLMYGAYALLLAGAAIGPRKSPPRGPATAPPGS
jgi:hypothetical protein